MGTSRWTKPMWVGKRAAKAGAFTTRRWWLPPSNTGAGHRTGQTERWPLRWSSPPRHRYRPRRRFLGGIRRERRYAGDITDDWSGDGGLRKPGYDHHAI